MAHFQDLTPYTYAAPAVDVVNIGWLDPHMAFTTRQDTWPQLARLQAWAARGVANPMRGFHRCPFCRADDAPAGNGEVWVPAPASPLVYAAPLLVLHYIGRHGYDPPAAFTEAVAALPPRLSWRSLSWRPAAVARRRRRMAERLHALHAIGDTTLQVRTGDDVRLVVAGHAGCEISVTLIAAVEAVGDMPGRIGSDGTVALVIRVTARGLQGVKVATAGAEIVYFVIGS